MSGTQVVSAYNTFNGKPIAIIVKTCRGEWVNYNALITPFSAANHRQLASPFQDITRDSVNRQYNVTTSFYDKTSAGIDVAFIMSDGGGDVARRVVLFNNVNADMTRNGSQNFVSSTARFSSYLVRDAGGDVIGIVFIQQGRHTMGT
jgi:hypothetical protein